MYIKKRKPKHSEEWRVANAKLQGAVVRGEPPETVDRLRAKRDAVEAREHGMVSP